MEERVYQKLGFDKIREMLRARTLSQPGAQLAMELEPSAQPDVVENLLQETAEFLPKLSQNGSGDDLSICLLQISSK